MNSVRRFFWSLAGVCVIGACSAAPTLSQDACVAEWNTSQGPAEFAQLLDSTPDDASIYFISADANESGSADCVLAAVTDSSGYLGVLNEDGDVQVSSIPLGEGLRLIPLGRSASVGRDGTVDVP